MFASDTRWTVVRGSDLEEGESQGLPVWSRHVGDPILESNMTRRVDFALFMVEALANDELVTRPRRSSAAKHRRRSRTPLAVTELSIASTTKQARRRPSRATCLSPKEEGGASRPLPRLSERLN